MSRRRKLLAGTTADTAFPWLNQDRQVASNVRPVSGAKAQDIGAWLDAVATLTEAHPERIEMGYRAYGTFLALAMLERDKNGRYVAEPSRRDSGATYLGMTIFCDDAMDPDQAELVFSDGSRQPISLRRDA